MNNRGIALILCYMVILVLTIFASAFVTSTISENTITAKQTDSTKAFWIAEAGLNQAYYDWNHHGNPTYSGTTVNKFGGSYTIAASNLLAVKVTGTFAGRSNTQRTIQASFVSIPKPFQNTLSVGGNLYVEALPYGMTILKVKGKTRISKEYVKDLTYGSLSDSFDDKREGVTDTTLTALLKIPNYGYGGDTYNDFVQMGRQIVTSYPANEVIYLQNAGYVLISGLSEISGKKVIFVEGNGEEIGGNVDILFWYPSPLITLKAGDDLTIIATGNISYVYAYQFPTDARLSTLSWGAYNTYPGAVGGLEGVIYTHSYANSTRPSGSFRGNVIVNESFSLTHTGKLEFLYSDRVLKGDIPPGFKWLFGTQGEPKLMVDWQEAE